VSSEIFRGGLLRSSGRDCLLDRRRGAGHGGAAHVAHLALLFAGAEEAHFWPCQSVDVLFLFLSQERGRGQMLGIDREGMIILAFGWLVALAVTLS
jgi:hypothetical protein